jgi:hypothetical protein
MGRFLSSTTLVTIGAIYILLIIPRTCDGGAADFFCPALTVIFIRYVIDRKLQFLKPLNPTENRIVYHKWWFEISNINAPVCPDK